MVPKGCALVGGSGSRENSLGIFKGLGELGSTIRGAVAANMK